LLDAWRHASELETLKGEWKFRRGVALSLESDARKVGNTGKPPNGMPGSSELTGRYAPSAEL
jgi:hypothetical protein